MKQNVEILIDNEELDLSDADIVLDFVLFNAENPESAGYTRSYTISVPATPKNNRLLSNMNAISVTSVPASYSLPCVIRIEGVQIAGISSLIVSRTTQEKYDCNILLGKSQLADALGDKTLQDLNLGQVTYQYSNMNLTDTSLDYINARFKTNQYTGATWYNLLYSWKVRALFEKIFSEVSYSITGGYPTEMDWTQETYVPSSSEKFDFEQEFENYAQANYTGSLVRTTPLTIAPNTQTIVTFDTITGNPAYFKTDRFEPLTKVPYRLRLKAKVANGVCVVTIIVSTNNINPIPTATALHTIILLGPGVEEADFQIPFCGGTNILGNVFVMVANSSSSFACTLSEISLEVTPLFFPLEGLFQYNFAKNLPAVSQREFVKNVLFLSGCIFDTDLFDKSIMIKSINSILNEPAKDWTDKIDFRSEITQEFMTQLAKKTNIQFKNTKEGAIYFETNNSFAVQEKSISIQANRAENEYVGLSPTVMGLCLSTNYYEFPSSNPVAHPNKTSSENDNIFAPFLCNPKRKGGELLFAKLDTGGGTVVREPNQNQQRIIEGSFSGNIISTFNFYTLPANSRRLVGVDSLLEFEPNFSYSQKLYEKYRKVVLSAYLSITDLVNLRLSIIFIGGNINRKFLLTAVRAWSGSNKPCKIELLLIDET
jgi:hypothetical protein